MANHLSRALTGAGAWLAAGTLSALAHSPGGAGNTGGAGPITTISAGTLVQGQSTRPSPSLRVVSGVAVAF